MTVQGVRPLSGRTWELTPPSALGGRRGAPGLKVQTVTSGPGWGYIGPGVQRRQGRGPSDVGAGGGVTSGPRAHDVWAGVR